MSSSIALDTPEQIQMWVLLSRRAQLKMQMQGLKTPGIVKWCRENIEGAEKARTARQCIVPLEFAISSAGGEVDYSIVNLHIMKRRGELFLDWGVIADPDQMSLTMRKVYERGDLEIVLTLDKPREPNGQFYQAN